MIEAADHLINRLIVSNRGRPTRIVYDNNGCGCWKTNQSSNFSEFQRLRRTNIQ